MLQRITGWRHGVVGTAVVGMGVLGGVGIIGAGDTALLRAEHFDAKTVVVQPAGDAAPDGVRITEYVDIDFGVSERRGYERNIPNDFGEPVDVTAFSPDANDQLNVLGLFTGTRIRIGNPSITFTGQRRYELAYTLPDARLSTGELFLDIIGTDETFRTDRFEVVVQGFDLDEPRCDVGPAGSFGGCELTATSDDEYRVVFEPLEPGDGISVGGTIAGTSSPPAPDAPPLADRNPSGFRPIGLLLAGVGALVAFGVHRWMRHRGSNVVFGSGAAADAAFGDLPTPQPGDPVADVPTFRVPDDRLADLATVEFSPPRGIEPWHGNVLLRERVDDDAVSAWFSEMVARGAIEVDESGDDPTLRPGPDRSRLNAVDRAHLDQLFRDGDVELGEYDADFTKVWSRIRDEQRKQIDDAGWWSDGVASGTGGASRKPNWTGIIIGVVVLAFVFGDVIGPLFSFLGLGVSGPLFAGLLTAGVVGAVAFLVYRPMLASRTATGSALTLRTESFRRFLEASEGRHVQWAWEQGLLREYSAWAVALGAADAWKRAIEASNLPAPAASAWSGPLFVHTNSSSFHSSYTKPSSSGSSGFSGGGGFSGGVGGGGGGGSSGSW